MPDAIDSLGRIPFWRHPSLFVVFTEQLGPWGYGAWGLILMAVLVFCYFSWTYTSAENAMYWSLAFSPIISPYVGSWDFVAMLPLLIFTISRVGWMQRIFLIVSYIVSWQIMALVNARHSGLNFYFWWVPLWMIATLALVINWNYRNYRKLTVDIKSIEDA